MLVPIISGVITFIALAAIDVFLGFMLLLSLNGYSERAATPVLFTSAAIAILLTVVFTLLSILGTNRLGKLFSSVVPASILSVIFSIIVGTVLTVSGVLLIIIIFPQK